MITKCNSITKAALDRLAIEIELGRQELNRISHSCRNISDDLLKMSQDLDRKIVLYMKLVNLYMPLEQPQTRIMMSSATNSEHGKPNFH